MSKMPSISKEIPLVIWVKIIINQTKLHLSHLSKEISWILQPKMKIVSRNHMNAYIIWVMKNKPLTTNITDPLKYAANLVMRPKQMNLKDKKIIISIPIRNVNLSTWCTKTIKLLVKVIVKLNRTMILTQTVNLGHLHKQIVVRSTIVKITSLTNEQHLLLTVKVLTTSQIMRHKATLKKM